MDCNDYDDLTANNKSSKSRKNRPGSSFSDNYLRNEPIQFKTSADFDQTPCSTNRRKYHNENLNSSVERWNSHDLDSVKGQLKTKNKALEEITKSVNTLAKKKGKLRSEIEHLVRSKNSFFEGLTKIRKLILSCRNGSILQYFPDHLTGLIMYDCDQDYFNKNGDLVFSSSSVPSVKHESEVKNCKKGSITMTQCMQEIEKYIKFLHSQFYEVENYKKEKDDCIHIFEKEVEELSKNWACIQEEKRYIEKSKKKLKISLNDGHRKDPMNAIKNDHMNMPSIRVSTGNGNDTSTVADKQDTFIRNTSMSVRHFNNNLSTVSITDEDRFRENREFSRNSLIMKELTDLKTKYESLKEKMDLSEENIINRSRENYEGSSKNIDHSRISDEKSELVCLKTQVSKQKEEIRSLNSKISELSDTKEEIDLEIRKLSRERDIIKEDIESYNERNKVLNQRLDYQESSAKDEIKALTKKIEEKNEQIQLITFKEQDMELKIVQKSEDLNKINHKIRLATENHDAMEKKIKQNSCLDMEIDNKNKILGLIDTKIGIREEELNEANSQLSSIKRICEEYSGNFNKTKIRHKKMEEEIRHFEKIIKIKKEELDDYETLVKNKLTGKDELVNIIEQRQKDLYSLENELAEKQVLVERFQEAIDKLLMDMENFTKIYEREKYEKSKEIKILSNEIMILSQKQSDIGNKSSDMIKRASLDSHGDISTLKAHRSKFRPLKKVINQSKYQNSFDYSPENICLTKRETECSGVNKEMSSHHHNMSEIIYQTDDFSKIEKFKPPKSKSSLGKFLNPPLKTSLRASSAGTSSKNHESSEPMSQKYFRAFPQ
ncbi:unnamed protein product [Moneuplotes crassus]|uniref:Uncharacterized protein n=1 Tax=Euplotes crassus TaxID=5936 RepID=A0AAD1Y5W1_EUPCR|nr:unnamed protein product [Moneuplotes crassus]